MFIGRNAAFEGVIANVVTAGFHRVTHRAPTVPLGSRDREVRYRLQVVRHALGWRPRQPASRDHHGAGCGHEWARDPSLFDLAMNRMETLVYKVRQSAS
jgi:hypothetical protein